ncbi:hypothetical protein Bca52824_094954 [Brassica carinata]|uniref:Uncharacterized protein n=1 Tax=Brassica carinata TaxID=52824 RepID=A0A8X7TK84_BRACI|nr:hypothetical protein Bca52824_094954 [Brassica carinata]
MPEECIEPGATFHPNLLYPMSYMSIRENKTFLYAMIISGAEFFTVIASDLFRNLNDSLELVPLPECGFPK